MFLNLNDFFIYPFLTLALLGVVGLSLLSALLSPFVIARRQAFMGAALSHATLVGLATGLSLFGINNGSGVFVTTLLITLLLSFVLAEATYKNPLPRDSLIGLFFTTCMGLGMIIHQLGPAKNIDLMSYLFGNIFLLTKVDLFILLLCLLLVGAGLLIPLKKWIYLSFSESAAELSGLNVRLSHYFFLGLLTLVLVSGLKLAGTVLINTLLIAPGMVALRFGRDIKSVFLISITFSLVTCVVGLIIANAVDLSLGPIMGLIQFGSLLLLMATHKLIRIRSSR